MTRIEEIKKRLEAATKPIPGFEGYAADCDGNIWSVSSNWRGYGSRILNTQLDKYGYKKVRMMKNGKRVKKLVHQLICLAFYGPKPTNDHEVCHNDGSRTLNSVSNLRWGTRKDNAIDRSFHRNLPIKGEA